MRPYEDGASDASEVFAPRHQFGRYQIIRVLGSGAFAAVYEAHDPALDATVAVKVLGDHHCGDADIRSRFIQEARLIRRGIGDRLVPVYDIGEQDGQPFFVMELLPLGTLGDRLEALGRPVSFEGARRVAGELAGCLDALHSAGIVHRDLKPSNLLLRNTSAVPVPASPSELLSPTERLLLGDFGIARDADASNLTMAGGTIGYMAPEQYTASADIDHRADIFAATAILTAVLTGRLQPAHPSDLPAVVPEAIRDALASGMAHSPNDRPQSAQEWHNLMMWAIPESNESIPSQLPSSAPSPSNGSNRIPQAQGGPDRVGATAAYGAPVPGDTQQQQGLSGFQTPRPQGGAPRQQPAPTEGGSVSSNALAKLGGGAVVALLAVVALFFGYSRFLGGGGGPVILGPDNVTVGVAESYKPEVIEPGATYSWQSTLNDQVVIDQAVTYTVGTAGTFTITLTETIGGEEPSTSKLKVTANP